VVPSSPQAIGTTLEPKTLIDDAVSTTTSIEASLFSDIVNPAQTVGNRAKTIEF
jgi:hypothetical protein